MPLFKGYRKFVFGAITIAPVFGLHLFADDKAPKVGIASVYIWGNNEYKLIPNEKSLVTSPTPIPFFEGKIFRAFSVAKTHAAALDDSGNLYQWGTGYFGISESEEPEISLKNQNISQVVCGPKSVYLLHSNGKVFILSSRNPPNSNEQKSLLSKKNEPTLPYIKMPKEFEGEKIVKIEAGEHHLAAITETGKMFTCSQDENGNSKGQLGIGSENAQELHQWHHVHGLKKEKIVNIACGSEHTLAQCKNDSVYGFGSNLFGQLGLGEYKKSTEIKTFPARINLTDNSDHHLDISQISAGGHTSFFVVEDDKATQLYSCGFGQFGQLGNGQFSHGAGKPNLISEVSFKSYYDEEKNEAIPIRIDSISVGYRHVLAILQTENLKDTNEMEKVNTVYSWGYNKECQLWNGNRTNTSKPTPAVPIDQTPHQIEETDINPNLEPLFLAEGPNWTQKVKCGHDISVIYKEKTK